MEPKDVEMKLRAFLDSELSGEYYQCVLTFTSGKPVQKSQSGIMISTVLASNANPANTSFAVFHGIMKTMELQVKNMIVGTYGGEIKPETVEQPQNYYR